MGFTAKIQLITGIIIWFGVSIGYATSFIYYKRLGKVWLLSFLKYLMIASSMIGSHQIFEYLSLRTGNHLIYKIGLVLSILGMYFYLVSLEKFYNRYLYSRLSLYVISAVVIYLFLKPVEFTTVSFHLSHNSIFWWSLSWFVIFMYWNICILFEHKNVKKHVRKSLSLMYLFFSMSISFLISVAYAVWGYYVNGINICTTYPSIWCTFGVSQVLFLPFFLFYLPRKMDGLPQKTILSRKTALIYLLISILIALLTIWLLSRTGCITKKFLLN